METSRRPTGWPCTKTIPANADLMVEKAVFDVNDLAISSTKTRYPI